MRKATSVLLVFAFMLFSALPAAANPENLFCTLDRRENVRHKSGPEVANRVKEMQRTNRNVRLALASFELNEMKSKHRPRLDDATSITIDYEKGHSGAVSFLKTSFASPQFLSGSIEVISIPTYSGPGEWQGTILTYNYDAQGNFLSEYISDVIMLPDPTYAYWDAILEVSYSWDGMFIHHGTMALYNQMGTPQGGWPATSRASRTPQFQKASFTPQPRFGPRMGIPATPRMKKALKCTSMACGAAAIGCAFGSIFFAEAPFAPCTLVGCSGGAAYCVLDSVFN